MSVLPELELRAQLEARRALGGAALVAWAVARLPAEPGSRTRGECVRLALAEAVRLADEDAVAQLAPLLDEAPRVDDTALVGACERSSGPAVALAARVLGVLAAREPSARNLLAQAGLIERAGRADEALALFRRAAAQADAVSDVTRSVRARVEHARLLALAAREVEALALASEIDAILEAHARVAAGLLTRRDALVLARVELASTGRYRRVRAIERLAELLDRPSAEARAALRLLARHVERLGSALTAPERDRVRGALEHGRAAGLPAGALDVVATHLALFEVDATEREASLVRLAASRAEGRFLVDRARALRDGGTAGPAPEPGPRRDAWLALSVLASLRARRVGEALRALRELEARQQAPEACAWTMARSALGEPALRASATSLLARWIGRDEGIGPPRGFLDLAVALERGGSSELASRTFAVARARQEPEARALSIQHAIRRAWSLHARGERREAYRLLRGGIEDASAGASPPRTA